MMSARHVHPTLAFEPRMQGRIKSGPPPKSGATTNSEISNIGGGGLPAMPVANVGRQYAAADDLNVVSAPVGS